MSHLKEDYTIRSSIHQIIKTNTSKKYPRLTLDNENKLIKSIKENHRQKYLELLNKRDYYVHKLNTLLNESIDDESSQLESFLANQFTSDAKQDFVPRNNEKNHDFNPKYITKRLHATQYVMDYVIPDVSKTNKIKDLIQKHFKFQQDFEEKRKKLIEKAHDEINTTKLETSISKLAKINSNMVETKKTRIKEKLEQNLARIDQEILMRSANLANESKSALKELHIPFFDIHESFLYPELEKDQEFMLDYLRDQLV